jgi:hypothetical protein
MNQIATQQPLRTALSSRPGFWRRISVKIRVLPVVFTLAMTAAGAVRADEVVATSSLFKATQSGGFSYHLEALYSGCIDASEWEGAAGSKSVHANDELWCHWKIQSRITRKVLFVRKPGVERALDTMPPTDVWHSATIYGEGRPGQGCGSSTRRFQSDYAHAVSGLTGDFDEVVNDDTPDAQRAIQAKFPDASNVDLEN